MIGVCLIVLCVVCVFICLNLAGIVAALNAQNDHYGIGKKDDTEGGA